MKKIFLLVILSLYVSQGGFAQEQRGTVGVGFSAGASNYTGDLDDNFTFVFTRPGFGLHATFIFLPRIHLRLAAFHGRIAASDGKGVNLSDNKYRNLSFYSDINEGGLHILYSLQSRRRGFSTRNIVAPYVFAGLAFFHFNPKSKIDDHEFELQKIGTEGQYLNGNYPAPYSLYQWSVPIGAGFTVKLNKNIDIGAETGFRKTFTDYLDDVSSRYPDKQQLFDQQGAIALYLSDPSNDPDFPNGRPSFAARGNPDQKDWYVYTNVHLTYYFSTALFKAYKVKSKFKPDSCKGLFRSKK